MCLDEVEGGGESTYPSVLQPPPIHEVALAEFAYPSSTRQH
jgi:hypothetical protein